MILKCGFHVVEVIRLILLYRSFTNLLYSDLYFQCHGFVSGIMNGLSGNCAAIIDRC